MNRCSPAEEEATARIVAAIGIVQVKVTTLNSPPRMNAPPTPDRCLPVSEPVSQDGRVISYRPNREKVNQKKRSATPMFTQAFEAKFRAPAAPRKMENRNPTAVKTTTMPIAYAPERSRLLAREPAPCFT